MADHDWKLERLAQGELDQESTRTLERTLGSSEIAARLAQLQAASEETLRRLPPETVAASIRRRLGARRRRWWLLVLPVAAAAGLVALWPRPAPDDIRIKGVSHLYAYQARPAGQKPARLSTGARVRPRDALQLAYTAGAARYGAIVSVDGRGVVTRHFPGAGPVASPLATTGEISLPQSYELDDAPAFERFFFVTAVQPFGVEQVLEAARALARSPDDARRQPLPLPPDLAQESLLLEKVTP
jgi:hypothetical protein